MREGLPAREVVEAATRLARLGGVEIVGLGTDWCCPFDAEAMNAHKQLFAALRREVRNHLSNNSTFGASSPTRTTPPPPIASPAPPGDSSDTRLVHDAAAHGATTPAPPASPSPTQQTQSSQTQTGTAIDFLTHTATSQSLLHSDAYRHLPTAPAQPHRHLPIERNVLRLGSAVFGQEFRAGAPDAPGQSVSLEHSGGLRWLTQISSTHWFQPLQERLGYCAEEADCMRSAAETSVVIARMLLWERERREGANKSEGSGGGSAGETQNTDKSEEGGSSGDGVPWILGVLPVGSADFGVESGEEVAVVVGTTMSTAGGTSSSTVNILLGFFLITFFIRIICGAVLGGGGTHSTCTYGRSPADSGWDGHGASGSRQWLGCVMLFIFIAGRKRNTENKNFCYRICSWRQEYNKRSRKSS